MARRIWKDRAVEKPRTFTIQNNPDGTVTLIPAPGVIVEPGTPVNATNLNGLEDDLVTHMDDIMSHGLDRLTWEKISEQTLSSDVAQVDFINIPSGYKQLRLIFETNGGGQALKLYFNDDVGNNYRLRRIIGTATAVTTNSNYATSGVIMVGGNPISTLPPSYGDIEISNDTLKQKRFKGVVYAELTISTNDLTVVSGSWLNNTEINKLSIKSIAINSGSRFALWGCK